MLTTKQQHTLDAAVNYTCNKIGGLDDDANLYQEAVDELDEECGEMDDLQFDEFSLKMFLRENIRSLEQYKSEINRLKQIYTTADGRPALSSKLSFDLVVRELGSAQDELQFDNRSLGRFIEQNACRQTHALLMINSLTTLLALPRFQTLPFVHHLWS